MSPLVGGGTGVGRAPDFGRRLWAVDEERRVRWWGEEKQPHVIASPIPGSAAVVGVDVWFRDPVAVLADGEVLRNHTNDRRQRWFGVCNVLEARGALTPSTDSIALAGFERRDGFVTAWVVTNERHIAIADAENTSLAQRLAPRVPGASRVAAVRLRRGGCEVATADGKLTEWTQSGWSRHGSFPASDLVLAGVERKEGPARRWWCVDSSREVWVADGNPEDARSLGIVDGGAKIVAVRLWKDRVEALDRDGDICGTSPRRKPATAGDDPDDEAA